MTAGSGSAPVPEDASLPLFDPPAGDVAGLRIGAAAPELVVVAAAGPRPFLLEGAAAVVGGVESKGACEIRFPTVPLVTTVHREVGVVANTMLSPGRLRRERVGRGPSVVEAILVAPGLPLVVFDWSAGGAEGRRGAGGPPIEVVIRPDAGGDTHGPDGGGRGGPGGDLAGRDLAIRYRAGAQSVTFAAEREPAGPDHPAGSADDVLVVVVLAGAAAPTRWTVEAASGGAVRCATGPTDATTLLVVAGPPDAVRTALRASSHAAVHERRAVAPAGHGSVSLTSGVPEVDDGFAWASTRLGLGVRRAGIGEGCADVPPGLLWGGLASVALGDDEAAATCVRALVEAGEADGAALLAGRLALTTGRVQEALACADLVLGGPPGAGREPAGLVRRSGLSRAAAAALTDGLRYAMPDEALERLRGSVAPTPPPDARASGGRRLPTIGGSGELVGSGGSGESSGPDAGPNTTWLQALFDGSAHGPPAGSIALADPRHGSGATGLPSHAAEAARAWETFESDPDAGWVAWRNLVSSGLSGALHGAGAWDDPASHDPPVAAAFLILGMLHGVLGVLPDAPVGRLRLAPRFPAHLTRFGVTGLPIGDARVDLEYVGAPDRHRFVITTARGRVPPFLVFEPVVPGALREVRIDGAAADVDLVRTGARTLFRLQTPLDAGRTIDAIREQ